MEIKMKYLIVLFKVSPEFVRNIMMIVRDGKITRGELHVATDLMFNKVSNNKEEIRFW